VAQLVLDGTERGVWIADSTGRGDAFGMCPGERYGEAVAGLLEFL
jgi:hypothetical protein